MEQSDAGLLGQEDIFDLDEGGRALRGKAELGDESEDDEAAAGAQDVEDYELLDSEEERERKVAELEEELDGLYDAYQEHLKERDAKYKVKQSLKNNKEREAWQGIGKDDNSDEDEDIDEGGYEKVQRTKARFGEDASDDDSSDESEPEEDAKVAGKKRRRADGPAEGTSKNKKARTVAQVDKAQVGGSLSRSAQLWFDQDMFAGVDVGMEDNGENGEDDEEEGSEVGQNDEDEDGDEDGEEASVLSFLHASST